MLVRDMNTTLLEKLVCPETQARLSLTDPRYDGDDVRDGVLCANGSARYPIHDGIPRFVPETDEVAQTAESFGQKWRKHEYYREHTARFYTEWFLKRYGFDNSEALGDLLRSASFLLDAGTGSGRDAVNFAKLTDGTVFAVDLTSGSLENARRTVDLPNIAFLQADINRLPFPDEFFDFINCDQVIHHTPDPPAAFAHLAAKLKCGGQICVYVYRKKAVVREFVDDCVREKIKHMSLDEALAACEGITRLGKTLADLDVTIDVEQDIPVLGIKRGTLDLQRFVHWNLFKCFWNDEFDFFTNNVINVDWYHPENCFRYQPEEFRSWFDEGWDIIAWDVQEAGLSCRARKR